MSALLDSPIRSARLLVGGTADHVVRLAQSVSDVNAAQALRFEVFNLELAEGLDESFHTARDADPFDAVCDHLLVEHRPGGQVVGTYRLQTGRMAAAHRGYYSEQEFDFRPFEKAREQMIELGRACVHRAHRNLVVLGMLWRGIADYARQRGGRFLCGCSSLSTQDAAVSASAYAALWRRHLAPPEFRTQPLASHECSLHHLAEEPPHIPKLLRAYLSLGAKICGPPALDRKFKTIDFLTWLDLETLPPVVRARFMG